MNEETTATGTEAQVGDPVTKIVSGDSVYPIRDAGALRDGEGTVSGTNLADGSVDHSKLAADVAGDIQELDDGVQALRDSVSRKVHVSIGIAAASVWYNEAVGRVEWRVTIEDGTEIQLHLCPDPLGASVARRRPGGSWESVKL